MITFTLEIRELRIRKLLTVMITLQWWFTLVNMGFNDITLDRAVIRFMCTLILLLNKHLLNPYRPWARCWDYNSKKKLRAPAFKDFMLLQGTQALNYYTGKWTTCFKDDKSWTDTLPKTTNVWCVSIRKGAQQHISSGNYKLKQWATTTHSLDWPNSIHTQHQSLASMWSNRNSHSLLVGMQNGTASLQDNLTVSK